MSYQVNLISISIIIVRERFTSSSNAVADHEMILIKITS